METIRNCHLAGLGRIQLLSTSSLLWDKSEEFEGMVQRFPKQFSQPEGEISDSFPYRQGSGGPAFGRDLRRALGAREESRKAPRSLDRWQCRFQAQEKKVLGMTGGLCTLQLLPSAKGRWGADGSPHLTQAPRSPGARHRSQEAMWDSRYCHKEDRGQCGTLAHKQFCAVTVFILNFIARLLVLAPPAAAECGMLCIAQENCIVLSVGEDSDDDDDDDVDVVLIQNFDTDFTENSSDEEVLLLLTDSEDDSDIPEELPVFSHGLGHAGQHFHLLFFILPSVPFSKTPALSSQAGKQRGGPLLGTGDPQTTPILLAYFMEKMVKRGAEIPSKSRFFSQPTNLPSSISANLLPDRWRGKRVPPNLQELTEIINSQINRLRELVSEIRRSLETPQMSPCGDDNPSLPAERQENDAETNAGGTSLQSAASPERQQLECSESPPLPVIVCACSLQPNHESGSPETRRFYLSLFNEGDESANNDLSSAQDSLAQPTAHLPQAESSLHDNFETVRDSAINNNMNPDTALPSLCIPPNFEMPGQAETTMDNSYQTVGNETVVGNETIVGRETVVGNDSDPDMGSSHLSILPSVEMSLKVETSQENDTPVMNQPPLLEYNRDEDASYVLIPSNFGYLGDPRRNVTIRDTHLMAVQKKAIPRHAACYLVRILFSEEILTSTSVGISSQGCQSLDPNKIAAIREHLAAVFPNYDLSEHGEEWQACISNVNSLICNLSSRRPLKTVDKNGGPTKRKRDSNDERDGDDGASSFQVSQPEAISETREHGNSPQNSRAFPEGIQEPSTDGTAVSSETLEYLGDPRRNIQMPKSLLMTAKEKSRPDLSARYLILSLFTEEVLINSVRGSTEFGVYSLNANKINALREFLQEIYPTCDLSENGYDWRLCVMAINSCIYSLRCDLEWPTYEIQLLPPTTPSTESKPKDPDLAD
ncbi:BEN domain-containing protein 2 [Bos mutus]|uniref:BEN domain-containing protein 2 n=1 Tax=Bos mutus TaxID=72004 RepID=L8IV81_9CETA|nr:BEN domain-containing protein 2 [Bos mutus]